MRIRELKGDVVDSDLKEKRKERAEITEEVSNVEEAEEMLKCTKELQTKLIQKGKEFREKELLDYHHVELIEEGEKLVKKKKKIIAGIRKKLRHNHTFYYLSRHVGKGIRDNIKRLQVENDNDNNKVTLIKQEEIESRIRDHNTNHFKKAHESIAYKDKIYEKLRMNSMRNRILNGTIRRDECDNERVYKFLKLLKQDGRSEYRRNCCEIYDHD